MANSMMDSILGMITPETQQTLASNLGASQQAVQSGLGTATAATLGTLASKAGDSGFLGQIIGLASSASGQNILGGLSSLTPGGASTATSDLITRFLPLVFGSQQSQITNAITQQAGVGASSAGGLLKVAGLLVLGYLAKMQSAGSLNVGSLATALQAEVPNLQGYLPSGLLGAAANTFSSTATRAASVVTSVGAAATARPPWLVPAAIVGALLLAFLVFRSLSGPSHPVTTAANAVNSAAGRAADAAGTAANAVGGAATAAWPALGDLVKVTLPDGTELNVPSKGIEMRLVGYLSGSSTGESQDTWFDFDRLLFDSGQATLQPASEEQLHNIAAILKAYPSAQIRLGGYTDDTGDAQANVKLSEDRADSVMTELVKAGVDASRMDAKGYGEANPIADNTTQTGRQKNRRISIRVAQK